jgi:DNA-directed RNA polymerase specialized sigma24 family protein
VPACQRLAQHEDPRNDQELIAAANAGDATAFEVLYFRYRDWVVGLAFRFTGDRDLALDVLQETFLYFLRKFPGFNLTSQRPFRKLDRAGAASLPG